MNYHEAKHLLRIHSGEEDSTGDPSVLDGGFLGMLRPYRGLHPENFHNVMQAVFVVGQQFRAEKQVDRDLVHTVWSMCSMACAWSSPGNMLLRNKLITSDGAKRLVDWIDTVERATLSFLWGNLPSHVIERYAQQITDYGFGLNIDFFLPFFEQHLEDQDNTDPTTVATAVGMIGIKAIGLLPALLAAAERTYPDWSNDDAHRAIAEAIKKIIAGK